MRTQRKLLRSASLLVPAAQRVEWLAEWSAELHYIHRHCPESATRFCLGGFRDALWLRRHHPRRDWFRLDSAASCLAFLAACAAACWLLALALGARMPPRPEFAIPMVLGISLLILPSVTILSPGEYPASSRARRWSFLAAKIALLVPIAYFGALDLGALLAPQMQPHGLIVGFVAVFRWALTDQRRRCPMCLRRLACPTVIGCSSHLLLEWYGTELVCTRGHGLMHVPAIASSYSVQRWVQLDRSWRSLFNAQT